MGPVGCPHFRRGLQLCPQKPQKASPRVFQDVLADTALFGSFAGTVCGLEFFGVDNVLFASDSPFDPEKGPGYIRETIKIVDALAISEEDRHKIYEGNARRLMKI